MSEGHPGAHTAPVPTTPTGASTEAGQQRPARNRKHARAQPYKTGERTYSGRMRRKGHDFFISGAKTEAEMEEKLSEQLTALLKRGVPFGEGPQRTTLAQALQDHALKHLPSLKGADQEARRINKYLRAARLPALQLCRTKEVRQDTRLPDSAVRGKYFCVWLEPHKADRIIPNGLGEHRKKLLTRTGGSDRVRRVLADTKVAKVTSGLVQALVLQLEAEGLAKATVMQEVALLRRLFNHASSEWHWIEPAKNPTGNLKVAGELVERERVMSKEEQVRLDDALETCMNDLVGPAFGLMTETAMRADECLQAKWKGVDWDKRLLRLADAKAGARNVPLSPRAIEILKTLGPSDDPEAKIIGISYEALKAAWTRACERAGVQDLHIQDLRHTAATRMALKSGNIFIVQKLTGHKTIEMVKRYVNVKAEDVVKLMHAPEPAAPQGMGSPSPVSSPAAMSQEALQAAMQMLQAAAAQLAAQGPSTPPAPLAVHRPPAANDAGDAAAAA